MLRGEDCGEGCDGGKVEDAASEDGGIMNRGNAESPRGWGVGEDVLRGLRDGCCSEGDEEEGEESEEMHGGCLEDDEV